MSEQIQSMHDVIAPAFEVQGRLNEALADQALILDRAAKTRMRKEVNRLKDMMGKVLEFKEDLPADIIDGMEEVIVNTEAKLDGKEMHFKADEELSSTINQMAA